MRLPSSATRKTEDAFLDTEKKDAELRTLLDICIEDIRFFKKQQWNTVYLTLVAFAALVGFVLALSYDYDVTLGHGLKMFLTLVNIVIAIFGMYFLQDHSHAIEKARQRKLDIRKRLEPCNRLFLGEEGARCLFGKTSEDTCIFLGAFWSLILFAFVISMAVLWGCTGNGL
jgi:hypothetical protein